MWLITLGMHEGLQFKVFSVIDASWTCCWNTAERFVLFQFLVALLVASADCADIEFLVNTNYLKSSVEMEQAMRTPSTSTSTSYVLVCMLTNHKRV